MNIRLSVSKAVLIACLGLAAIPLWVLALAHPAFDYTHAWVSAHHATMIRAFVESGIRTLGAVPVQNNLPLTTQPDFYVDWPPLFDIILAVISPLTGQTPGRLHLLMAALATGVAALLGLEIRRVFGRVPGLMTTIGFLLMPITLKYGYGLFHVHLAMAFSIASLCCWRRWVESGHRTNLIASALLMALGTFTSWEPILLAVGVFATIIVDRTRARRFPPALIVAGAMAAAFIAVIALYVIEVPWAAHQIYAKAMQQSGQALFETDSAFRPHDLRYLENNVADFSRAENVIPMFIARALNLGGLGLIALPVTIILLMSHRNIPAYRRAFAVFIPLAAVWLLWAALMRRHYFVHEYESSLAAPAASVAIGILTAYLLELTGSARSILLQRILRPACIVLLAATIIASATSALRVGIVDHVEHSGVDFGTFVQNNSPAASIVLTSAYSMVPMYYAHRHLIQGVEGDEVVIAHWNAFRSLCLNCFIYLAIPESRLNDFPRLVSGATPSASQGGSLLFLLAGPNEGLIALDR
jgi:hypothetical protein